MVPEVFGIGVAYEPQAYDSEDGLYAPYYVKRQGELQLIQLEDIYDYTKPQHDWYHIPLTEGPVWQEPYFEQASDTMLAEYTTPFYRAEPTGQQIPAGVVRINYSLEYVKELIDLLELEETGYGFILSKKGAFIYHPNGEYVEGGKTIFDLAKELNDENLAIMGEQAINGESGDIEITDQVTGQSSWVFYEPLPSAGWSMGVVFVKNETVSRTETLRRQLIWIGMGSLAFLVFLSMLLFRAYGGGTGGLWRVAVLSAFLFIIEIGFVWYLTLTAVHQGEDDGAVIADHAAMGKYLLSNAGSRRELMVYIPTGVLVQSIEFSDPNEVSLTGYIWQKYYDGAHDDVSRDFVMPGAVKLAVTEAYHRKEGGVEVIGWHFQGTLRQRFDFSTYPIDRRKVRIQLWHADFDRNVILIPDLDSYEVVNPSARPGVKRGVAVSGWIVERSFFSYLTGSYRTNFGIENLARQHGFPDLYFNLGLRRNFLDAFIVNMLPLSVVIYLLFATLLLTTKSEKHDALIVLARIIPLLFVVVLAHVRLRGRVAAEGIIYIEYVYIVAYLTILGISVNSILLASDRAARLIRYQNSLVLKLLYWPIITGLLLGITLLVFY